MRTFIWFASFMLSMGSEFISLYLVPDFVPKYSTFHTMRWTAA